MSRTVIAPDPQLDRLAHAVVVAATGGTTPPGWLLDRLDRGLAGVCLFGRNIVDAGQLRRFTDALRDRRPDVLVCLDEEGGDVTRLHRVTGSPHLGHLALGVLDDPAVTRATGAAIGVQLRAAGIDWNLAPVADLATDPDSPVIGVRSFGADAPHVARHACAYLAGLHDAGVLATAKHFPGHGATAVDSHLALPRLDAGAAGLEPHLAPFAATVAAGVDAVMLGHLLVPAWDEDLPASVSPVALRVLRDRLGFTGVAITDALEMAAVAQRWGIAGAAVLALVAGVDAVCLSGDRHDEATVQACVAAVVAAVENGTLPERRLVEAAGRVAGLRRSRDVDTEDAGTEDAGTEDAGIETRRVRGTLRVRGDARLAGPVQLVVFDPAPSIPAGPLPWYPERLGDRIDPDRVADAGPHAPGLLIVVRDLHRHPTLHHQVQELTARRPDAVVVEMGVPVLDPGGRAWVRTHGTSAAARSAIADLIRGTDAW